jgi:hypothetical protein
MTEFDKFVRITAEDYLRSVVFVDDKIMYGANEIADVKSSDISTPPSQYDGNTDENMTTADSALEEKNEVDEKETKNQTTGISHLLSDGFAKKGIACALYRPEKNESSNNDSSLFRLCERADIIILDWDLHNDDGETVSNLLKKLITKSRESLPHHLRLCIIYTSEPELMELGQKIKEIGSDYESTSDFCSSDEQSNRNPCNLDELKFNICPVRIAIFGKEISPERKEDEKKYEVSESELADKTIEEFMKLHNGLLSVFALHGLAAIRENTDRILSRFHSKMDNAFLLHRGFLLDDHEAFEEFPGLLSDELLAVLEDIQPENITDIANSFIDKLELKKPDWKKQNGQPYEKSEEAVKEMLKQGHKGLNAYKAECVELRKGLKNSFHRIKTVLLNDFENAIADNDDSKCLTDLFCNRRQYTKERVLRFGTIVRYKKNDDNSNNKSRGLYAVCVMAICDCQRLTEKKVSFPFLKLKEVGTAELQGKYYGVAVKDPENKDKYHHLRAGDKAYQVLCLQEFKPDENTKMVIAEKRDNSWIFPACNDNIIVEWVAELKPLHTQRIAAHFGADISRVGLIESEWSRLWCDR